MYRFILRKPSPTVVKRTLNRHFTNQNEFRQAGFGKYIIILSPFIATGGVVAYAKHNEDFRKLVSHNVPGAESFFQLVLGEHNPFDGVKKNIDNFTSSVTGFLGTKVEKKQDPIPPLNRIDSIKASTTQPAAKNQPTKSESDVIVTPKAAPAPQIQKNYDNLPTEVTELESAVEISAALAVQEYNKAIKILNNFNEDVKKIVEQSVDNIDPTSWSILKNKTSARDTSVSLAERLAKEALDKIEKCEIALSKVANADNHERIQSVRNKISKLNSHINKVKDELYRAKDVSAISEKYWKKVESARNYFIDEIESLFPGLNLAEKKLNLRKEDLDLFVVHAYSHVLAYQKELQRIQTEGDLRLKRAIESLRGNDNSETINAQLGYHLEKERRILAIENQKKIFKIQAEAEKELRKQLKRCSEAHVDHLTDALTQKESELRRIFNREMDEKLSSEKAAYKLQLASMLGKLKGMDAALKARAESERCAHQAQALWAACQALWATVRTGEPGVHWSEKLRPLKNEIQAVFTAAADGDELVKVILTNLPKEAEERGVFPEDALRERFLKVENVARKVALVPEEGASLPIYFLSFIQSLLIIRPNESISQEELQNETFDFSKLDTYDILNRARYFSDRGDLVQTLKYMNLLQGAPRKVARDWLKEARLLLETQQAANTLMAHAAASGLLYL